MNPHESSPTEYPDKSSYRKIFASTSIIGTSSVVNVVIGIARMKMVAVLLGPIGIGFIGLLTALMSTASTLAQLGLASAGVRQIAEAHATGKVENLTIARRALVVATLVLAPIGGGAVWFLREPLAMLTIGDSNAAGSVGLIALGVALSVAASAQMALIRGMRRMWDLAWIAVLGAVATTILGVPLVWWLGRDAAGLYVLLGPLMSFVFGYLFVARLPKAVEMRAGLAELKPQWMKLLRLGIPLMGAGIAATLIELWIRIDVRSQLGEEALGHFQASWTIAAQYVGFVLGAMGADYLPRLTGVIPRPADAVVLVNQQTEVALLLAGPVILAMLGLAPWVIDLLYSAEFADAADMLRWQAMATALKVASWPLGFIMLAAGAGRTFFLTETLTLLCMAGLLHVLIEKMGLAGAGLAYLATYVFYLPLVYWLGFIRVGFRWTRQVAAALGLIVGLSIMLFPSVHAASEFDLLTTSLCLIVFVSYAAWRLRRMGLAQMVASRIARTM